MSIEIARGCTEGCRFCQAGMIYRPVRERDPEQIVETVVNAVKKSGYDEASLTSLSTADYSCIAPLVKKVADELAPKTRVASASRSLRAYGLDENVLDDMARVRATGVTFAPEAGTQRMRDVINKNVTEEQLLQTAERIFSRGWSSMKLYFMIGLPTEEEEDVRAIPQVGGRARAIGKQVKRAARRAGHAERHRERVDARAQAAHALPVVRDGHAGRRAREAAVAPGGGARGEASTSGCTTATRRGSRPCSRAATARSRPCSSAPTARGARFDSWEDQKKMDVWEDAFAAEGVDPAQVPGDHPRERAPAVGPHRRGARGGVPPARVPQGAEEPPVAAVRQGGRARSCTRPTSQDAHADDAQARLLRLRRRVRPRRDARAAPRLPAQARRRRAARPRPRRRARQKGPPPRIEQGEARRYRFVYEKLGRGGVPLAPRRHPRAAARASAGSSCRSSTRRASTPSRT